jgi:pimeloyl-ACP methyl ester carboxylesterase
MPWRRPTASAVRRTTRDTAPIMALVRETAARISPAVLVVQSRRDPVTPHRGGELLDEKFGDRSRLVSVDGSGHGVYVIGDNACALNTTTSFLVDGKLPQPDMSCK